MTGSLTRGVDHVGLTVQNVEASRAFPAIDNPLGEIARQRTAQGAPARPQRGLPGVQIGGHA